MTTKLNEKIKISHLSSDQKAALDDVEIISAVYHKSTGVLSLALHHEKPLKFETYYALVSEIKNTLCNNLDIQIDCDNCVLDLNELNKYMRYYISLDTTHNCFKAGMPSLNDNCITFLFAKEEDKEACCKQFDQLTIFLNSIGLSNFVLESQIKNIDHEVDVIKVKEPVKSQPIPQEKPRYHRNTKMSDYLKMKIIDMDNPVDNIQFEGRIFKIDEIVPKSTGRIIQSISIEDGTSAVICKRFENNRLSKEEIQNVKEGQYVRVFGSIQFDSFTKDLVCMPRDIVQIDEPIVSDDETKKRIELHAHTTMSEMDGVCEAKEIVDYAYKLGHDGVAITDHAGVQAFVKAHNEAASLNKANPDKHFKVMYGCEMNLVDEKLLIVRNIIDKKLDDCEYVSFDLETTGLSCYFDHIIEFGAVKIKNSTIIDRKQMFIKPPISIPLFITNKTNITNDHVKDAKTFAEAIDEILDWIGDDVLVAHNATFDYGFLNEELRRIERPPLTNVVIDTLDFARAILSDRRAYRLGNIARNYRINYDEEVAHRADYDAEVLAEVFMAMLRDANNLEAKTLLDLQNLQSDSAFAKVRKSHIVVMAKNSQGIKDLYDLVTISNTESLAIFGKANSKSSGEEFLSEPRIFRNKLEEYHQNLLFGSACLNGEVFEYGANRNQEELERVISFYDYIEVQPLENYAPLLAMQSVPSVDRLKAITKRIIETAIKLKKIVVATGDVHYCTKEEKQFRDIYIATQGIGGVRHPLYIYNSEVRRKTKNPDQHFRTTKEMLNCFSWLEDDDLVNRIVVDNTHQIYDMIEAAQPVPSGTYPPHIEGSSEKLSAVCYKTAHEIYGEQLPTIVEDRLKRELKDIIDNGYSVVYYISHLLVKKSNEDGYLVGSRGSVGSSFVATMSGITEVNPLKPHYICPKCHHVEWIEDGSAASGFDLPDKECPECHEVMKGNGQNIPFETFLGFKGDKVPDIDLNFSNEYQAKAHAFTKEIFGEDHVFRAGTIGTVAEKTAFGYVTGYCEEMGLENMRKVQKEFLAAGCEGVKRTTGQHPGGIIVIPDNKTASDFTPVQYPANDPSSEWKTTHFDFHDIHDNVLKFDILGHVDPTAMRLLQNISGIDPTTIPMNDPETISLFSSADALHLNTKIYNDETGALGLPEFGTRITRRTLEETKPKKFSDLVIISGLSHGTDVWAGNAEVLVKSGIPINEVIGCRDDIMTFLLGKGLEPLDSFTIMESVRKGKGLKPEWIETMQSHNVPEWYIESCKKIKYMFPKAHAVAYVIMAIRIAWYKVHYPHWFYIQFLSLRCDAYEIETMVKGIEAIQDRMNDISSRMNNRFGDNPATPRERSLYDTLEVCQEMYARGYKIGKINLYKSKAVEFCIADNDTKTIIPPFITVDGLGTNVAKSIEDARKAGEFLSKEDLMNRTQLSQTLLRKLEVLGCLEGMQDSNQMSLF